MTSRDFERRAETASFGMPTDLPGSPYSPTTGQDTTQEGQPTGEAPVWEPDPTPTPDPGPVPGDGDGDGIPDDQEGTQDPIDIPGTGEPGGPPATPPPSTPPPEEEEDPYSNSADEYKERYDALATEAEEEEDTQVARITAEVEDAKDEYDRLAALAESGTAEAKAAAEAARKEYEVAWRKYQEMMDADLSKTTAERMAEARNYALAPAQEDALRASTLAIQQGYRAARTAGLLPGQAALAAAQEIGASFSDSYTQLLQRYDQEYQTADRERRAEIEAQATKFMEAAAAERARSADITQKGIETQKDIADSKAAAALEGVSQMNEAERESLNARLDALLAEQTGDQGWARLTLEQKIIALQERAAAHGETMDWLDLILGGIAGILGVLI